MIFNGAYLAPLISYPGMYPVFSSVPTQGNHLRLAILPHRRNAAGRRIAQTAGENNPAGAGFLLA